LIVVVTADYDEYEVGAPLTLRSDEQRKDRSMPEVKEAGEVYKCEICGNVVEVKEAGGGELVCCGEPMVLVESPKK
jgi:desulfoferrodoxin-like iron-binding protein